MLTEMAAALANGMLRFNARAKSAVNTLVARGQANLGTGARIGPNGRVQNIRGRRESIEIGAHSYIDGELLTFAHDGRIQIGEWCFIGRYSFIWSSSEIVIGDRVLVSHQVNIHDTNSHPLGADDRAAQTRAILTTGHPKDIDSIRAAPIRIGDDAWIGYGASIGRGVTIGERAIVAARAIVERDVPADTIFKASNSCEA